MATIYDIAKKADVSYTAVSDILNCGREHKYPDATIKKVRQVAAEVGYRRNVVAGSLRQGKTKTIGITSNARSLSPEYEQPYNSGIFSGVGQALADHQVNLMFNFGGQDNIVNFAGSGALDGLIFIMYSGWINRLNRGELTETLDRISVPIVCIHSEQEDIGYPSVGLDCKKGGYMAATHMIEHGYETVGFVGDENPRAHNKTLYDSYVQAMIDHDMDLKKEHIHTVRGYGTTIGYNLAESILKEKRELPRAFMTVNDTIAFGMMTRFREEGILIPEDVAFIGVGSELNQMYCSTDLTSLRQPVKEKGKVAAEMLLERLNGNKKKMENLRVLPPELVIRKSCGCNRKWDAV